MTTEPFRITSTGVLLVPASAVDEDAIFRVLQSFEEESAEPNFPGIVVDFDFESLEDSGSSAAAAWVVGLGRIPQGLWAELAWTDVGREAVNGGRYQFVAPAFHAISLDEEELRPSRLSAP